MDPKIKNTLVVVPKYDSFDSLPVWAQNAITKFCSDDGAGWISKEIPALEGKSFLEVINLEGGEEKAKIYFKNVIGKFFPEETFEA